MTPTKLINALFTMSFAQPDDGWYMDSEVAFHITHNYNNFLYISYLSTNNHILVGNSHPIPIISYGHILAIRDILLAPQIIRKTLFLT